MKFQCWQFSERSGKGCRALHYEKVVKERKFIRNKRLSWTMYLKYLEIWGNFYAGLIGPPSSSFDEVCRTRLFGVFVQDTWCPGVQSQKENLWTFLQDDNYWVEVHQIEGKDTQPSKEHTKSNCVFLNNKGFFVVLVLWRKQCRRKVAGKEDGMGWD